MSNRAAAVTCVAVVVVLAGACGGGRDAASQKACTQTSALLKQYDEFRGAAPEIRAVQAQAMSPTLAQLAQAAKGEVHTSIGHLAAASDGLDLDSTQPLPTLEQQVNTFDTRFAKARTEFTSACA